MKKLIRRIAIALENIVMQLRVLNSGRDAFYREVLDVLTAAKDLEGSLRSVQPAAAPDAQEELTARLRKLVEDSRPGDTPEDLDPYDRGWNDGLAQVANDLEATLDSAAPSQQEGEDG